MKTHVRNVPLLALLITGVVPAQNAGDADVPAAILAWQDTDQRLTSATVNGTDMFLPEQPALSINFHSGGVVSGNTGVNRYFGIIDMGSDGTYQWQSPGIALTNLGADPALMDLERNFLGWLWSTNAVRLLDNGVAMSSQDGSTTLTFTRPAADKSISALQNVEMRLIRLVVDGRQVSLPSGARITFKIVDDTRFTGRAAVNLYSGSFRVNSDGSLEFLRLTEATQMAGPPELMDLESTYFNALGAVQRLRTTTGGLVLEKNDRSVVLEFTSQR